jgi:hypothetical protein
LYARAGQTKGAETPPWYFEEYDPSDLAGNLLDNGLGNRVGDIVDNRVSNLLDNELGNIVGYLLGESGG